MRPATVPTGAARPPMAAPPQGPPPGAPKTGPAPSTSIAGAVRALEGRRAAQPPVEPPSRKPDVSRRPGAAGGQANTGSAKGNADAVHLAVVTDPAQLKEAFLEEIRKTKKFFHGTVVAQAQRIELQPDAFTFVFAPQHRALRAQLEQSRTWLESAASQLAGRKMAILAAEGVAASDGRSPSARPGATAAPANEGADGGDRAQELKDRALADNGVQAMLDVFAAEIKDIEEM